VNRQAADIVASMLPALFKLGADLLAKHNGDEHAARSELQDMVDHGARYLEEHNRIKAKIDAAVAAEKKP
jgi:hypothetical protein